MEQMLQLHRVTKPIKQGEKVLFLQLTDVQLHTNARPTTSVGGVVQRSIEHDKPGRVFSPLQLPQPTENGDNTFSVSLPFVENDPKLKEVVGHYIGLGYRVMLVVPHNLPVKLGNDAVQFLNSKNGKRLLRGMEKKTQEG